MTSPRAPIFLHPLTSPRWVKPALLTPLALCLVGCGPGESELGESEAEKLPATTPTSPVTTPGSTPALSAADIRQLSPSQMIARLTTDFTLISEQIADPRDVQELESDLMRVEEMGTDYRTLALRIEREIANGDETYAAALQEGLPALQEAYDRLIARRDALMAAYPSEARNVEETFDKFDFGLLEGRVATRMGD